jgi:CBS domain-containing protein
MMELTETLRSELIKHLPLPEAIVVSEETPISEVIEKMVEARRGCVLIDRDGRLHGLASEKDILVKFVDKELPGTTPVREIMATRLETLCPEDTVGTAIQVMARGGYRHVPLADADGKILGMMSARDIVSFIVEHFPAEVFNLPPRPDQRMVSPEGA